MNDPRVRIPYSPLSIITMRLFVNEIEVSNYAFITEVYPDKIILDRELHSINQDCISSSSRVYDNIGSIAITKAKNNIIYLDNEKNWHFHKSSKEGPFGISVTHGAMIIPYSVPESVRRVLYCLFKRNTLRVAGRRYAEWQKTVTFPKNREFELAWKIENLKGTHNPDYRENEEISVCTCDFCNEKQFRRNCEYYCGENMKLLRSRILNYAM